MTALEGLSPPEARAEALALRTLSAVRPRTLRRNATASAVRWVVTIAVLAAVYPLMIAQLGADGFGLWAVLTAPTGMLALAGLGVAPATVVLMGRALAAASASDLAPQAVAHLKQAGQLCAATMVLSCLAAAATIVVGWLVTEPILTLLGVEGAGADERFLFRAAVVCLGAMLLGSGLTAQLEAARRVDLSSLSWGAVSVLNAVFLAVAMLTAADLRSLAVVQLITAAANLIVPIALLAWSRILILWRWMSVDRASARALLRLAVGLGGAGAFIALTDPVIKVSLGATVGMVPVASYEIAQRIVKYGAGTFSSALQPLLAHISGAVGQGDKEEIPGIALGAVRAMSTVSLPALTLLALAAPSLIALWLGDDAPTGTALSIAVLCPGMAATLLATPCYHAVQGLGHGFRALSVQAGMVAAVIAMLGLTAADLIGASYAGSLANSVGLAAAAAVALYHFARIYGGESVLAWSRALRSGLLLGVCCVPLPLVAIVTGLPDIWQLAAVLATGAAVLPFALRGAGLWRSR